MPMHPGDAVDVDLLEMDLEVICAAAKKARHLLEDNADKDDPTNDALTLRQVYSLMLDISGAAAGARAMLKLRKEMLAALASAPVLRLVK